jgi:hypothetical protein
MKPTPLISGMLAISLVASCTVMPVETGIVLLHRERDHDHSAAELTSTLAVAGALAGLLLKVADDCRALNREDLRIDCLGAGYAKAAESIPTEEAFSEARAAVADAGRSLRRIARENRATSVPTVEAPSGAGPLVPVAASRQSGAEAEALAILERTQTVLLRSSETGSDQAEAYTKIAAALDSGKVLMRS